MTDTLPSILAEFRRYRALAERAVAQLDDAALHRRPPGGGNSIAVVVQHVAGNLASRFTQFLAEDGEKPWRDRDAEFDEARAAAAGRAGLMAAWDAGWATLLEEVGALGEADLARGVTIRGEAWSVAGALHRALAHVAYHVGQIVLLARAAKGDGWEWLSVPPGGTAAYNANPTRERHPGA